MCKDLEQVEDRVYGSFGRNYANSSLCTGIMLSTNKILQQRFFNMIQHHPCEVTLIESIDECIEGDHKAVYDSDLSNRIIHQEFHLIIWPWKWFNHHPDHNLSRKDCNGNRCIIQDIKKHLIKAKRINDKNRNLILIPRIPTIPRISKNTEFPIPFKCLQFPVFGAYYLPFNLAQSQSLSKVGIYLPGKFVCT